MSNPSETFFMKEAIRLSALSAENGFGPFGAVVVKDGKIVGRGHNRVVFSKDPTAHAEVEAIRDACKNLDDFQLTGCTIYSSCEPCPMCLAAIYWSRADKIVFANTREEAAAIGFDDEFLYQEMAQPLDKRKIPIQRMELEEARLVFENWQNNPGKTPY